MHMSTTARLSCYTTPRKYEMNAPVQQEMTYIRFCKLCMCGESKREKKKKIEKCFFSLCTCAVNDAQDDGETKEWQDMLTT